VPTDRPAASIPLPQVPPADPREGIIAVGVRELLQSEHLGARPIDDEVSRRACERFIEYLDPGKFFLLQPQVEELRKHADELDDQLKAGDLYLARLGHALRTQQRHKVAELVARLLAKPFDFSKQEFLETDPDKRTHAATEAELEDLWRRNLKLQVLERMATMRKASEREAEAAKNAAEGAEGKDGKAGEGTKPGATEDDGQSPRDKARKEPLPTTDEGREKKAREDLATNYAGRFKRLSAPKPLEAVETFINAITAVFDPHTHYMAPDEQANFDIQMSGSLEGIGAVLTEDDHYIEIREVVPGGAAWRQGDLEAGDLILSVKQAEGEAVDVADMRLSEVVKLIRGPKGTVVTLSVRKPDDRIENIEITRDVIVVEASYARGALLDLGDGYDPVGYIYLPSFYGNTRAAKGRTPERNAVTDVRALLELFTKKKVRGVVLDLRGNGGGLLSQATDITGLFIERGPVVQAGSKSQGMKVLGDRDPKVYFDGEVVALVDRFSASASEILAGALQDYGRALVVGTGPTHGKGTVQMLVNLDRALPNQGKALGVLKLTIQQFFLVDGESTQQRGVQPDVVLPDPASFVESGERYLDNAIPWSAVDPLRYSHWPGNGWKVDELSAKSKQRQSSLEVFSTIAARSEHLAKRRDDTRVPLESAAWTKRRETEDAALESLDPALDEQPPRFSVDVVEYRKTKPTPDAKASARVDTGERIKRWRENLARDPWVAESLHLLHDMEPAK
jgi:carboxyl-terminal processing protease